MKECLFCKIAAGEIPARIVFEDDKLIAVEDIEPAAPVHILIIPRSHIGSLNDTNINNLELLGHIQLIAAQLAKSLEINKSGFRLVNNNGDAGGQAVPHLHYHLLGGRQMNWPPG